MSANNPFAPPDPNQPKPKTPPKTKIVKKPAGPKTSKTRKGR